MRTHYYGFRPMADIVPESAHGAARVEHLIVKTPPLALHFRDNIAPGRYALLKVHGQLVMSDTQHEQDTNRAALFCASGDVLIGGLGLGMLLLPMLAKATVRSVRVVERSADVIALVHSPLRQVAGQDASKLTVVQCDVRTYQRQHRERFDFIYMDIWPDICVDNLEEMQSIHRRYRPWLRRGGTVTSWLFDELKEMRREGRWR